LGEVISTIWLNLKHAAALANAAVIAYDALDLLGALKARLVAIRHKIQPCDEEARGSCILTLLIRGATGRLCGWHAAGAHFCDWAAPIEAVSFARIRA
jgi:hypothetical protein